MNQSFSIIFICVLISCAHAVPKKYSSEDSASRYYESSLSSTGVENATTSRSEKAEQKEGKDRLQRFGIGITSGYGGYGGNTGIQGPGYQGGMAMMPLKIDLGGVFLGALVGVGAILLIPKLAHVFSHGYGGGYRSLDDEMSSISNILSKIDNSLEQHNIDSSSCMQRAICTYVHESQKNMENGDAGSLDQFIFTISNNSLVSYLLDGTAIKQAVELGKKGDVEKCSAMYMKCPVNRDNIMQVIASLLPA